MADFVEVVLRFLHITFGIAWIGASFYSVGVLSRVMPRIEMPARKRVMQKLMPVALHYIPMSAVMTIVLGAILYLYMGEFKAVILLETRWGQTILAAFILTVATFAFGMTVVVAAGKKIVRHLDEEACTHQAEVATLQKRFTLGQPIILVLGLIIIALMVAASRKL